MYCLGYQDCECITGKYITSKCIAGKYTNNEYIANKCIDGEMPWLVSVLLLSGLLRILGL